MKRAILCLALVAGSYSAFAQADLLGTWKGKPSLDMTKIPKAKDAQQQKQMDAGIAQLNKMAISLTFLKGGKYTAKITGSPTGVTQTEEGTWKLDKDVLTTTATKQNGKPPRAGEKPQKLAYNKSKKKLSMTQGPVSITFTK